MQLEVPFRHAILCEGLQKSSVRLQRMRSGGINERAEISVHFLASIQDAHTMLIRGVLFGPPARILWLLSLASKKVRLS